MADDTIKGMLQEVQRSLDRTRRALEVIEQRQQRPERVETLPAAPADEAPVAPARRERVETLPAAPTPAPAPRTSTKPAPASSPSAISYTRRKTAAYENTFLTPDTRSLTPAPSRPASRSVAPTPEASSGEVASRADLSDWSSGERPVQRSDELPPSAPPSTPPPEGRYQFIAPRQRKK